ncbi:MAG: AraC family transcriptional regulator [Chryseolinea sp.]
MKRYLLHTPFNIYHFTASEWAHPVHNHTYFEIIFILKGKGNHHINGNVFKYQSGDVFLLGPEDFHHFDIHAATEFCFIRFNETFYKHQSQQHDSATQKRLKALLYTSSQSRGSIVQDKKEKKTLHVLLSVLEQEYINHQSQYFEAIRDSLMQSIMTILARNLTTQNSPKPIQKDSAEAILMYVKEHIYDPAALSIEHLADVFHYAPEYISIFFKRHTGQSLKQYIISQKIKLIETRLLYSQVPMSAIADEFGYTDESHLCRQFRKYTGYTPSAFRKGISTNGDRDGSRTLKVK